MSCGVACGRQEAIDEVEAILLNELVVEFGRTREIDGENKVIGFPYTERGEFNSIRDRAGVESNPAFKPFARSASRDSQVHQNFFVRHATA